jgi:hypothetical protein
VGLPGVCSLDVGATARDRGGWRAWARCSAPSGTGARRSAAGVASLRRRRGDLPARWPRRATRPRPRTSRCSGAARPEAGPAQAIPRRQARTQPAQNHALPNPRSALSARPALVPRRSRLVARIQGVRRVSAVNGGQGRGAGGRAEIPGQGRSSPGGECGASSNRTSDLTVIRAIGLRHVWPGEAGCCVPQEAHRPTPVP